MSLEITGGDSVLYGGASASGYEETPELRYEVADKTGVRVVTAVLTRKIHCLSKHAEAIKQSAAFPGQIVSVGGTSYGAGWNARGVSVSPSGESAIVQIESEREGITPFEWELPPKLSVECSNGIAKIYYTKANSSKIEMLRFDSQTGEDRYGWRVDYISRGTKRFAVLHEGWYSVNLFDVKVYYEGRQQLYIPFDGARFANPSSYSAETATAYSPFTSYATATAEGAETSAKAAIVARFEAEAASNRATNPMDMFGTSKYIMTVDGSGATATLVNLSTGWWCYKVDVPVVYAVYDADDLISAQNRGIHWESVADADSGSATYQHVFYRLVYGNTVLVAIDITAAEGA